jgi:hypothetical protein
MAPNLSGSCSHGCRNQIDHAAASGKCAEFQQERENHHPDSGALSTQFRNLRLNLAQLIKGVVQLGVEHSDQVDHVV